MGNYFGFIIFFSYELNVTFVLSKVKVKVFWGSLEKGNVCFE